MRRIGVVQARVASKRLPGKVLRPLNGEPALVHVMHRVEACRSLDEVILATSNQPENDALAELALRKGWICYRGSEDDVLSRFVDVTRSESADLVARVCADNFAIDPSVIERGLQQLQAESLDVCSPFLDGYSYPFGAGAEVATASCLYRLDADTLGAEPAYREHVFFYAYQNRDRYRVGRLDAPPEHRRPEVRISVDTREDWTRVEALYQKLEPRGDEFTLSELISAWDALQPATTASGREQTS